MKIVKFGGTSVGSSERMRAVANIVTANKEKVIVVLSAMSGVTNKLEALGGQAEITLLKHALVEIKQKHFKVANELLKHSEKCKTEIAFLIDNITHGNCFEILALGEQLSTLLFNHYLLECGFDSSLLNALDFMVLNSEGEPDEQAISSLIRPILEENKASIYVTQGFVCRNKLGAVSNLKRGGSDYSAALIGAAIHASIVEIWTDIDGFHNNDPRFVENTKSISCLSFSEAAELAYFGAKILHPATIWPARRKGISVQLKNTLVPSLSGTIINDEGSGHGFKAVAAKDGITAISIRSARMLMAYGFLSKVFGVF
ncbi:MAG: aspartate kinase, partial [Candidatus Azotimanducaceae bacterium]